MSLINDALKKAQRQRHEEQVAASAGDKPATRIAKRGRPLSAQLLIIIAAGAAVLIILSAVVTVYLLNRTPEPVARVAPRPAPAVDTTAPSPIIVAPVANPPAETTKPAEKSAATESPATKSAATTPSPTSASIAAATSAPAQPTKPATPAPSETSHTAAATPGAATKPAEQPPAAAAPATTEPGKPDARIQAFVDSVRVAGIRSSGADSKVLMNDRVYRINDTVDSSLGVKLIKVAPDSISFSDENGVVYKKYF